MDGPADGTSTGPSEGLTLRGSPPPRAAAARAAIGLALAHADVSALDCLHLAPGRGFSSPGPPSTTTQGFPHGPRRRSNRYHPRVRGVQASQLPDQQEQAQQPRPGHACASTAAGVASTPAIGRRASAGAPLWPVTVNAQSSAAIAALQRGPPAVPRGRRRPSTRRAQRPGPAGQPVRADLPGALDHASGDVDEFDAALVRGAGGVPAEADTRLGGPEHALGARNRDEAEPRATSARTSSRSSPAAVGGQAARGPGGTTAAAAAMAAAAASVPSRRPARPCGAAIARSASCAPAGPSCSACSGPTAARSPRRRPSCSASSRSPASTSALADYVAKEIVEFIL